MKIAIIGSGISGLTALYLLSHEHSVALFEKNDYLGGHTHTIEVQESDGSINVDTGFIVFNDRTYPKFMKLLHHLGVAYKPTEMSFSFKAPGFEYAGHNLNTLFAQRKNLLNLKFYRLIKEILRFNCVSKRFLKSTADLTMDQFIRKNKFHHSLVEAYLYPMIASIWSMPYCEVGDVPARFLLQFYLNHGLLDVFNRPQWYVVENGSKSYVDALIAQSNADIRLNTPVTMVKREAEGVLVETNGSMERYDKVIIATHSDEALKLLADASSNEASILSAIPYFDNRVVLHTDTSVLPKNRRAYASWNYQSCAGDKPVLHYYMNKLQSLVSEQEYIVSVNPGNLDSSKIIKEFNYAHPSYASGSVKVKSRFDMINGVNHTYFTGAYWGNGFHEDGVAATLAALKELGVSL